ncbi:MAG: inorganic phosphate transporter [Micrococcaceae bacterium]
MEPGILVLFIAVLLASSAFTVIAGGHDAPNAIALPVRARALSPRTALLMAGLLNAFGVVVGSLMMAHVGREFLAIVPHGPAGLVVLLSALLTAFAWDALTWWRGVPTSSSHALAAGVIGGGLALLATDVVVVSAGEITTATLFLLVALVLSPLIALTLAWLLVFPALWFTRDASPGVVKTPARMALAVTAAGNAFGHGLQFGQRMYLVLAIAVSAAGLELGSEWWITVLTAVMLGGGTLLGGWRIAHTLTDRLVLLDPLRSSIASFSSALLMFLGSLVLHLPVSSSHAAAAAIVGAGQNQSHHSVNWPQVVRLGVYFVLTLVVCAAVSLVLTAALTPLVPGLRVG